MSLNFSQLQTLTLSWLDDPLAAYFTPAQVNVWLNNAQKEVQKKLIQAGENYYVTKMQGLFLQDEDTYYLPSDFKKCHKLEIVVDGTVGTSTEKRQTLEPVTLVQLEDVSQSTGRPVAYNIRRNTVTVRPIPDDNYTVYLSQSYQCTDMVNSTDLPDCPEDYAEYIAVLATLDGFMKDQRDPTAFIKGKQEKYERMLEKDAADRQVQKPKMVVVTEFDGYGMLF